jgi:hypothetical protein
MADWFQPIGIVIHTLAAAVPPPQALIISGSFYTYKRGDVIKFCKPK